MATLVADILADVKKQQSEFHIHKDAKIIENCVVQLNEMLNDLPEEPEILFQYATGQLQLGNFAIAAQLFKRILSYWPSNPHVWANLGCAWRSIHHIENARKCFLKSLQYDNNGDNWSNLASTYINEDQAKDGIEYARKAMELKPQEPKPSWNYSLLNLEIENWAEGFKYYDAGFGAGERDFRSYTNEPNDLPMWTGEEGVNLILWDEQGLGDRLLAANCLRHLENKNLNIIFECHPRLVEIYKESFPWIQRFETTVKKTHIKWPASSGVNQKDWYKISTMSLMRLFWSEGDFDRTPYIHANKARVGRYRKELSELGDPPYIAVSWAGGARKTNTKYRSLKIGWFDKLIEMGGTWVSMQYHDFAKEKVERFRASTGLPLYHLDAAQKKPYIETLAALSACDLTITACNSVVHTLGASGLPGFVMVPKRRAWRYPASAHFPWYGDNLIQIHQETEDNWEPVIVESQKHLERWLSEYKSKAA